MASQKGRAVGRKPPARRRAQPADNRRGPLLDAAARLFGERGFDGTSTRDIAAEVGMLAGSIYYHFRSKHELLLAVHEEGVRNILEAVQRTLAQSGSDPWERLESACVAHLESLLGGSPFTQVVTPQFTSRLPAALRRKLIAQRDSYEKLFARLVDDLPLPPQTNSRYLRLALLGSLNWVLTWYHAGGDPPAVIAHQIVQLYRLPLDTRSPG